jgi:integrase
MISQRTVTKLMDVARNVDPRLPLLITLMDTTGRRLSSVLGLRWDDFDFEAKTIRFRAELDKRRKTWSYQGTRDLNGVRVKLDGGPS